MRDIPICHRNRSQAHRLGTKAGYILGWGLYGIISINIFHLIKKIKKKDLHWYLRFAHVCPTSLPTRQHVAFRYSYSSTIPSTKLAASLVAILIS